MFRILFCSCVFMLSAGCFDIAARQQKAEAERREATVEKLKKMGEEMHQKSAAAPDGTTDEESSTPEDDSTDLAGYVRIRLEWGLSLCV